MADNTKIEWTDATWQPITGCSIVSPGCTNCYAMKLAGTRLKHIPSRVGLTKDTKAGPVWTGKVRFNEEWLGQPLGWKRPRRIFVCAHGDLFAEGVPDKWIDEVVAVMALAPQHTFQVLTKRSARMRAYLSNPDTVDRVYETACDNVLLDKLPVVLLMEGQADPGFSPKLPRVTLGRWPLANVWLGVSAEDHRRACERVPDLLQTPAAVRFVSAEPLLGPINFTNVFPDHTATLNAFTGKGEHVLGMKATTLGGLDWIIVGAESGPGAREMRNLWAEDIVIQCQEAGAAPFVKQLSGPGGRAVKDMPAFPPELRVRDMPAVRV